MMKPALGSNTSSKIHKTRLELDEAIRLDGGVRRGMHEDLAREHAAFERRPKKTEPREFALEHMQRRAEARATPEPCTTGHLSGKTDKELEAEKWYDGGVRRSMHHDLTLAKEAYATRPTNEAGKVKSTIGRAEWLRPMMKRAAALAEAAKSRRGSKGSTVQELHDEMWKDSGTRKKVLMLAVLLVHE
jgi:hypothetical protein